MSNIEGSEPPVDGRPLIRVRGAPFSLKDYMNRPEAVIEERERLAKQFEPNGLPKSPTQILERGEHDE